MITVYSKIELTELLKKKVIDAINAKMKSNYTVTDAQFNIDKHILSGVKIDIDSEVIDLTVNNTLEKIIEILK